VPALPAWLIEPLWVQCEALLPKPADLPPDHPLGCHKPASATESSSTNPVQVLVFGCSYQKIADHLLGHHHPRTPRRMDRPGHLRRTGTHRAQRHDRIIGLELADVAVDGWPTKAPGGGQVAGTSPVDRGTQGMKRSTLADANSRPVGCGDRPCQHSRLAVARTYAGPVG
jgi:hypothetical protein